MSHHSSDPRFADRFRIPHAKKVTTLKTMRLQEDTREIYEFVKQKERFSDDQMLTYLLEGLDFLNCNKVKYKGFARGRERNQIFARLSTHYDQVI